MHAKISRKFISQTLLSVAFLISARPGLSYIGGHASSIAEAPGAVNLLLVGDTEEEREAPEIISTCSAAVIAPRWILTAAHCVDGQIIQNLRVSQSEKFVMPPLGSDKPRPGKNVEFKRVLKFPGFKSPDPTSKKALDVADVALIELKKSISITPARLALSPPLPSDVLQVGGWGIPAESTDEKVHIIFNGEDLARLPQHLRHGKRSMQSLLKNMFSLVTVPTSMKITFAPGFDEPFTNVGISAKEIREDIFRSHLSEHISIGDSGGSVYRINSDGTREIVGVNSLEDLTQDQNGIHIERFARVDAQSPAGRWVNKLIH